MRNFLLAFLLLLSPCSLFASAGVVQQTQSTFVNGSTVTAQFPSAVTPGDLILVHAVWSDNTLHVNSIGDTLGNTYSAAVLAQGAANSLMLSTELFYAANVFGGATRITLTLSGSAYLNIFVYEIAGAVASNPLDLTATGNGTGLSVSTGSITTSAQNEFVFVGTGHHFGYDTVGVGFTGLQASETGLDEFQTVASAGTVVSGSATLSATNSTYPWAAFLAAFKTTPPSGGGGNPTLNSIQLTPYSPTLSMGLSQQLTATGLFSDGSTQNLTSSATWAAADGTVATVNASGLVTAAAHGTTTVTASSGSVSGSTPVTVEGSLSSIQVTPASDSLLAGTTQQLTATGSFSDGTSENITGLVGWSSSNTSVATINSSGLATALAGGNSTITATSGAVTGSTALTVTQPAGGSTAVVQTPLVQSNYQWMTPYFLQNPPHFGGASCTPAPCVAQTFLNPNGAGNLILVWVSWNKGGFALSSLSDSAGNQYTHVPGFPVANPSTMDDFWVAYNVAGSPNNKITALFGSGTVKPAYMQFMEFSGLLTSNALDTFSNVSQNQSCTAPCTMSSSPLPTTTQASDLLVAVFDFISCGSSCAALEFTTGSGWSPVAGCDECVGWGGQTVSGAVLIEQQVVSSTGSYTATAVENAVNSPTYNAYLFAFKQAPSGP